MGKEANNKSETQIDNSQKPTKKSSKRKKLSPTAVDQTEKKLNIQTLNLLPVKTG